MKLTDLVRPLILERQIVGLTGGGDTKLDGIVTLSIALSPVPRCEFVLSGVLDVYYLTSGTDAESLPDIVRPDDYDGATNAKVWKKASVDSSIVTTARSISTTAPLTGGGDLSANRTIAIPLATSLVDGYLSKEDRASFVGKQDASANLSSWSVLAPSTKQDALGFTPASAGRSIATTAPLTGGGNLSSDLTIAMPAATDSAAGYLTAADHSTFSGKQNALGFAPLDPDNFLSEFAGLGFLVWANISLTPGVDIIPQTELPKLQKTCLNFLIDGGGVAITTGSKGWLKIPAHMALTGWEIFADASGSIVVDIKRATYSGLPTFSSIAASAKPTLSSAQKNVDTTLTGWTTALADGDWLEFVVSSAATVQRVQVVLIGNRN